MDLFPEFMDLFLMVCNLISEFKDLWIFEFLDFYSLLIAAEALIWGLY